MQVHVKKNEQEKSIQYEKAREKQTNFLRYMLEL